VFTEDVSASHANSFRSSLYSYLLTQDWKKLVRRETDNREYTQGCDDMATCRDDQHEMIAALPAVGRSCLVTELCAIQKHAGPVEKVHEWAEDLLCLQYEPQSSPRFREMYNHALNQEFVAVSWTRQPSKLENPRTGKYSVQSTCLYGMGRTATRRLDIRNSILDPVVVYLVARNLDLFWIDEARIRQGNAKKKAEAINSIDLVYKKSTRNTGLLSSSILTSNGAALMARLFDGKLTTKDDFGKIHLTQDVSNQTVVKVVRTLEDLIGDDWWKRAWIYQEEYLSGLRMDLLIPIESKVRVPSGCNLVPGEFCVQATRFREQTSRFLWACPKRYRATCNRMLMTVEKFSITLQQRNGISQPMSATILAGIEKRDIKEPWDTLAITADACAYQIRLDAETLAHEGRSLSLSLLAQFLLNGEIFVLGDCNDGSQSELLQDNVNGLLYRIQPQFDELPVSIRKLTFLEYCRPPSVSFYTEGLKTVGCLWNLPEEARIYTCNFGLPIISNARRDHLEACPWDSLELSLLADELEFVGETSIAVRLRRYLNQRRNDLASPARDYMDLMACKIFQAIDWGFQLRLGYLDKREAMGIFIPHAEELHRSLHVMTTWQPPQEVFHGVGNAVSLQVNLHANRTVSPVRWINGLVFFSTKSDSDDILIKWPLSWTRSTTSAR
jgi:hypothetical protein